MLGALRLPAAMIHEHVDYSSTMMVVGVIGAALVGFSIVLVLEKQSARIERSLGLDEDDA